MFGTLSCGCSYREGRVRKVFLKDVMSERNLEERMGASQAATGGERTQKTFFKH